MPDTPDSSGLQLICKSLKAAVPKDLLFLHHSNPERYPALLESAQQMPGSDAFDILFAFPQGAIQRKYSELIASSPLNWPKQAKAATFLSTVDQLWSSQSYQYDCTQYPFLPFKGGWFLYMGYEIAQEIEPSLMNVPASDMPQAFALRIPAAIIYSHSRQEYFLIAEPKHADCIDMLEDDFESINSAEIKFNTSSESVQLQEDDPDVYLNGVERIKQYITDGDVFQANLSRAWQGEVDEQYSTCGLYARLRNANPAPFAGIVHFDGMTVLSSSPERLLQLSGGVIQTRPIAGTYPRSSEPEKDLQNSAELILHPKERAEHIMLVDLERNDLGRLCEYGSIEVDEMMVVESYKHVHHIVSNVRGNIRKNIKPGEVIAALFPGGTITGCPKVRCMEILFELEGQARGAYTGSMGYLNHDGDMDLNILIRTIVHHNNQLQVRAGAGIVVDSEPQRELEETRSKAKGMLKALNFSVKSDDNE